MFPRLIRSCQRLKNTLAHESLASTLTLKSSFSTNNILVKRCTKSHLCTTAPLPNKSFSTTLSEMAFKNIGTTELLQFQQNSSVLIVDVREPKEINETGILPGAINIPLGDVGSALALPEDAFEAKYGKPKPTEDQTIVFSCRSGKRSTSASEVASKLGFINVNNFTGGWLGWEEYTKAGK